MSNPLSLRLVVPVVGWDFSPLRKQPKTNTTPPAATPGTIFKLKRDPSNKHDVNAVEVYHPQHSELHCGFLPKDVARWTAALLDAGIVVEGRFAASDEKCIFLELVFYK